MDVAKDENSRRTTESGPVGAFSFYSLLDLTTVLIIDTAK